MHANPSTVARTGRAPHTAVSRPGAAGTRVPAPPRELSPGADPAPGDAAAAGRRPTRGVRLTVEPADRRRRAQTALLELVVTRSAGRRRA
ncbi:hypothetical protein GCM10009809_21290 [Isoptericola hypogeus]|uniref:Uncharacterized protein n=1 Tax=Isoptericola hypogeus TaxID=300179 RepID=A0ABN2JHK7_9MICO